MSKIFILNTTIATTPGLVYKTRKVGIREARSLVFGKQDEIHLPGDHTICLVSAQESDVISAIGHESTALIASKILNRDVKVNRIEAKMMDGDIAVCIKLRGRAPEGVIFSESEINDIGYDIVVMEASDPSHTHNRMRELEKIMYLLASKDWNPENDTDVQPINTRRRTGEPNCSDSFLCRDNEGNYWFTGLLWGEQVWIIDSANEEYRSNLHFVK
jgi:hypothetical protein